MGALGGSRRHRRLGRSYFYELLLAPLSVRERVIFGSVLILLLSILLISQVGAGRSDVGNIYQAPFATCKAGSGWSQADLAAGQPDAESGSGLQAVWHGGTESLTCSNPSVDEQAISDPLLYFAISEIPIDIAGAEPSATLNASSTPQRRPEYPALKTTMQEISSVDDFLLVEIRVEEGDWTELGYLTQSVIDDGYAAIELPAMSGQTANSVQARISVVAQSDQLPVGIDGVSIFYTVEKPAELSVALSGSLATDKVPVLSSAQAARAKVSLKSPDNSYLDGLQAAGQSVLGSERTAPTIDFNARLQNEDQSVPLEASLKWLGTTLDGTYEWEADLQLPHQLTPGTYLLRTDAGLDGSSVSTTQEVLYGVVAINTAKSAYTPGESVDFLYSVLDERGRTVCDAEITTTVFNSQQETVGTLSTQDSSVQLTDTCPLYGSHIEPDYEGGIVLNDPGTYRVETRVVTADASYTIPSSVEVSDESTFITHRTAPTRIYPVNEYDMTISLKTTQDFNGQVFEDIPAEFKLVEVENARPFNARILNADTQRLTWDVALAAGDSIELKYRFDAPDVSPEFYLLGPLTLESNGEKVYTEPKSWQIAGDAIGHMLLFYAGGSVPSGWTCVSCSSGDAFYQRFVRANDTYGATGGSATHNHTASIAVAATGSGANQNETGSAISDIGHTHSASLTITQASNLPSYRQLKIIRSNTSGEPTTLPAGVIGMFDAAVPSGWTQYSAQNGYYVRGENTTGTTGGSNTHSHPLTMTINPAAGATHGTRNPTNTPGASAGHTHTVSGSSTSVNQEPPFLEVILGELNSSAAPPDNLITMWDDEAPTNWAKQSGASGSFYQKFIKASSSYGSTGGNETHFHNDSNFTSSGPSATTNSRSGSSTASGSHTHTVNVTGFNTVNHMPPYIDVVVAKRVPQSSVNQSAYRFYQNLNSTDVGTPLGNVNSAVTAPRQGKPFRLRFLLHVSNADLSTGNRIFKLQFAERSGTCDTSFSGETFSDLSPSSGAIRYHDNASPSDGSALTTNANDPTHSGHTVQTQTYEEANNFTNTESPIAIGEDGMWDVALVDYSAVASTSYCFRVVRSNGDLLESYTAVPEIITDDGNGHMLLLYDGGSVPSGWSCVSCNPGDDFYQRFFRGSDSYGTTGGSANHNHTGSASVQQTTGLNGDNIAGSGVAAGTHTHSVTASIDNGSNLPTYRQLKVIRANTSGVPSTLPSGAIAFFDNTVPSGWTRYSAQDGNYVRSENTVGSTGGSLTHTHPVSGSLSASSGTNEARTTGGQVTVALDSHTHTITGNTQSGSSEPPYRETILGQLNSDSEPPQNIIVMWDGPFPVSWTDVSSSGQPFYQRFVKPAASYGATGGSETHSHPDSTVSTSVPNLTSTRRSGSSSASGTHTHNVDITSISTSNHLPPYIEVMMAKQGALNTDPDDPINLDQERPSDSSSIAVDGWANSGQVRFMAEATDTDNPDDLQLCVEIELIGTAFDDVDTQCGSATTYSGSPVFPSVTVSGLSNGSSYHWQVRIKDGGGGVSNWVSFGGNAESEADFTVDSVEPSGTVYDGPTTSVDVDFNDGSLDELEANWDIIDNESGINSFEYAIGTVSQGTDVSNWTNVGTATSAVASSLSLKTAQIYFFSVRAADAAGNETIIVSDGIYVAPTLTFSASPGSIVFDNLGAGNSYTDSQVATLTTSTNAYGGYEIRAFIEQLPTSQNSHTIGLFNGGTYAAPDTWLPGDTGYGYTSNDNLVAGVNRFNPGTCAGGGSPPCFAPFATVNPGDIVADNTGPVQGTAIVDENFLVTHRVTVNADQPAGTYTTSIIYTITARY